MSWFLLLPLAFAKAPSPPPSLLIDAVPPSGLTPGPMHSLTWAPLPSGASPTAAWTSDFAPITCSNNNGAVLVDFTLDPAAWPYKLPASMTCTQGASKLTVALGFGQPDAKPWRAADGALVVPHRAHSMISRPVGCSEKVTSATMVPAVDGVSCEPNPLGELAVDVDGAAPPGEVTCRIVFASGKQVDQRIVILRY